MYGVVWNYGTGPKHTADVNDRESAVQLVNALRSTGATAAYWELGHGGTAASREKWANDRDAAWELREARPAEARKTWGPKPKGIDWETVARVTSDERPE